MIDFVDHCTHCEIVFYTAAGTKITAAIQYGLGWGNTIDDVKNRITTVEQAGQAANQIMWQKFYAKPIPKIPVTKL